MAYQAGGRRGMTIVCVMGFLGVLTLAGTTGLVQRSAARRAQEWSHAHRVLEAATDSALEEACARIEASLPDVPQPSGIRDLAAFVRWPITAEPEQTRRVLAPDGGRVGRVSASSSPWVYESIAEPGRGRWVREVGVIELETSVEVSGAGAVLKRRVTARRYAWTAMAPSGALRVQIGTRNLLLEVKDS